MRLIRHTQGEDFLDKTLEYLERNEAANNLMLGIAMNLSNYDTEHSPYLATVEDDTRLLLAAVMTPPHKVVIYGERDENKKELEMLLQDLRGDEIAVPGVLGPSRLAIDFSELWRETTDEVVSEGMSMRVYRIDNINHPKGVKGKLRMATEEDHNIVSKWMIGFHRDTGLEATEENVIKSALRAVKNKKIFLWEDGAPVSMAARTRPTRNGIVINSVYTPHEFRGRGYASACVAALSQRMLDSGYQFCSLFTDLANTTSNSIYMKVGYRPVCDFREYIFSKS